VISDSVDVCADCVVGKSSWKSLNEHKWYHGAVWSGDGLFIPVW
jgi:hypothetical protein